MSNSPPTLAELPPPPSGKTGWPWTEQSDSLPEAQPNGSPWPQISIVTPSYNQGQFIEETIRSVILQRYPNLEYIVMDGGSTDDTIEILEKYDPWITEWNCEPDKGQSHAINKGLSRCSGDVFNWINSDDYLARGALATIGKRFAREDDTDVVAGFNRRFDQATGETTEHVRVSLCPTLEESIFGHGFIQAPTYFRLPVLRGVGRINEELDYNMDTELFVRYLLHRGQDRITFVEKTIAHYRLHDTSKTVAEPDCFQKERREIFRRLFRLMQERIMGKASFFRDETYSPEWSLDAVESQDLFARMCLKYAVDLDDEPIVTRLHLIWEAFKRRPQFVLQRYRLILGSLLQTYLSVVS